ncbi:MAG: carboxypeptidase-like regulatory domain-containing protein, partial [Candidatus Micrarchaeota archaeon]
MEQQALAGLDKKKIALIAGVAAIAVIAVAYFVFLKPPEEAAAFTVTVIGAEGERVSGATVEVFDGAELLATATTANGKVELPELPKKLLSIRVTTPDGKRTSRLVDLSRSKGLRIDFSQAAVNETEAVQEGMQLEVKDSQTKQGIANAKVVYQFERNTETTTTNAAGRAT